MSSEFSFSKRSKDNLSQVHPRLVAVMTRALELSPIDFVVTEGLRTPEKQKEMVAQGASQTQNSKHLAQKDGYSHAVDVAALVDGQVSWVLSYYSQINDAVQAAAHDLGERVTWGGYWKMVDGPHFQIDGVA